MGQDLASYHGVVGAKTPHQGLFQGGDLLAHQPFGQVGQHLGVALAPYERFHHGPARLGHEPRRHRGQLDAGILEGFVQALDFPHPLVDERLALCRGPYYAELFVKALVGDVNRQVSSA